MNHNITLFLDWFKTSNLRLIERTGYPSSVETKIFEADLHDKSIVELVHPEMIKTFEEVYLLLNAANLIDNKIVILARRIDNGEEIHMGWKDGRIALGHGVHAYDRQEPTNIESIN